GPAGTALRRQGRAVAWAEGPRHHRPRLRHEAHRRGETSAASGRRKARARVVTKVRQSAQPPADRSVQRLRQRRRCTAPAHCWAAGSRPGPPSARQGARTDAAPCLPPASRGTRAVSTSTAALCPCRSFVSSPIPLVQGCWESLPLLKVSGCAAPATGPLLSFLPPDKHLECTAAGLLRQGQALQASVRADRSRRPCTCRETGGAHACLTRRS